MMVNEFYLFADCGQLHWSWRKGDGSILIDYYNYVKANQVKQSNCISHFEPFILFRFLNVIKYQFHA